MSPAESLSPILKQFDLADAVATPVEGGHINRSWRVGACLLQRINPEVFPQGELVVRNVTAVCDHLRVAADRRGIEQPERRILRVVRTFDGQPGIQAEDGAWWRMLNFIDHTRVFQRAESPALAGEAGAGFGLFQRLLSDYAGPQLAETIPGFHDTRLRLERLAATAGRDGYRRAGQVAAEIGFANARRQYAEVMPSLIESGAVPLRVVHNDAKIGNLLFDQREDRALAVVDLDTVMPGTLLSDVGDLIRSMASPTDEDERDLSRIRVSRPVVEGLIRGFAGQCGAMLTSAERELLIFSGILLAYEQGVRFLTDYLEGDRYYRITGPEQNLDRARAQFALVAALEEQRASLERLVAAIVRRET